MEKLINGVFKENYLGGWNANFISVGEGSQSPELFRVVI